jgi:hypothetical protein
MSYLQWLRAMADLQKDAEFLLMDASERVSAGGKTIEFLVTEGEGYERLGRRSGRNIYQTRIYLVCPDIENGTRIEANESTLNSLDKTVMANWGFSLRDVFNEYRDLFEGVYASLKQKVAAMAESSKALLEATMGEKILKLVAERLQGDHVHGDIKSMLDEHIRETILSVVMPEVRRVSRATAITKLGIKVDNNFTWEFENDDENFNLDLTWKSLRYRFTGRTGSVSLLRQEVQGFCVRDALLLAINLTTFGDQIANTIEKVCGITTS